jgi:hypothetical protein
MMYGEVTATYEIDRRGYIALGNGDRIQESMFRSQIQVAINSSEDFDFVEMYEEVPNKITIRMRIVNPLKFELINLRLAPIV